MSSIRNGQGAPASTLSTEVPEVSVMRISPTTAVVNAQRQCDRRPIRQDYLDELVWNHLISTLSQEDLVRDELGRRTANAKKNDPLHHRQDSLQKELTRTQNAIDKLLDAYQEDLLDLATLRQRIPNLKKRELALQGELQSIRDQTICASKRLALEGTVADFRSYLLEAGASLTIEQRQKVLRLLVREITVGENLLTINHSIPISQNKMTFPKSYELCTRGPFAAAVEYLPALRAGPLVQAASAQAMSR